MLRQQPVDEALLSQESLKCTATQLLVIVQVRPGRFPRIAQPLCAGGFVTACSGAFSGSPSTNYPIDIRVLSIGWEAEAHRLALRQQSHRAVRREADVPQAEPSWPVAPQMVQNSGVSSGCGLAHAQARWCMTVRESKFGT
jgi:hypothetical protein